MKKLLLTLATAFMSLAAMAQYTVAPRMQQMWDGARMTPAPEGIAAPGIKTSNQVSYLNRDCLFDTKDGQANIYSFMVFDYRLKTPSIIHFTTDNPLNYKMMVDYGMTPGRSIGVYASSFVGDKILAYTYMHNGSGMVTPYAWVYISPKDGTYEIVRNLSGNTPIFSDMTYDPETKKIYAIEESYDNNKQFEGMKIYSIDPADPNLNINKIAFIKDRIMFTIAADRGNLYSAVAIWNLTNTDISNSYLIKMPISSLKDGNPVIEEINRDKGMGIAIHWSQSMDFDKINHRLWWSTQDKSNAYFCEIDPEKGTLISKKRYEYNAQNVGLSIPYQDVNPAAPSYVRNLKAVAADNGLGSVSFSWTNPSTEFYLAPLKSLTKIKIIRDGEVVNTIDATGIGMAQKYEDKDVPSGNHIYKIQTVNENGDGVYKDLQIFVGRDVPAGVSGIKVTANGCKATISWNAPSLGVNRGWIDKSSIKYDVVRYPDSVKIASDITECQINDEITKTEGYIYEITSKNADGVGGIAKSDVTVFGPAQTIPFFTNLNNEKDFNRWTVIDNNNDYISWSFNKTENVTIYDRAAGPADDFLVSPKLNFEEGKKYQVRFKYWTINWVDENRQPVNEKMDIFYAQEPTADAFNKEGSILYLKDFHTPSETYLYAKQVFTAKPGDGYIAFHACSDAYKGIIYLQDVCIREFSATDLSITDFKGSISAVEGASNAYAVEVMNEGSATVDNYTVELINAETGDVLASTDGISVNSDEKKMVTIEWTPASTGELKVTARVNLKGDTYETDNTWDEPINVTVAPSGSAKWLSLNKDDAKYNDAGEAMNMGYAIPFNITKAYNMAQCIYLDKEITKKKINITGIQFVYDGKSKAYFEKNVKISAIASEKDFFKYNEKVGANEAIDYADPNWINLYEGFIKIGGMDANQKLTIEFNQPYYYEGGNLVFMFEKLWDEEYLTSYKEAPMFHYHDLYDDGDIKSIRTCIFRSNNIETPDRTMISGLKFSPFTMLQYKDGSESGIMGITADGLSFDIFGGKLTMSDICNTITVYDLNGKIVAKAYNTNAIDINKGVYVIKAAAGNKSIECKVNIR